MDKAFEFFEHTADIGVHVFGADLPELFTNAARAMFAALGDLKKTEAECRTSMELMAESLEDLLHDWLTELLFEVEAHHVLYDRFESLLCEGSPLLCEGLPTPHLDRPQVSRSAAEEETLRSNEPARSGDLRRTWELKADLAGGAIDFAKSQTREEIKAVTYHRLRVEQLPDGSWRATVIFDV